MSGRSSKTAADPAQSAVGAASGGARTARPVYNPGSVKGKRRPSLVGLGLLLMVGAGFGFWWVVQSLDVRETYVITSRTLEPWDVLSTADLITVQADIGEAAALTPAQVQSVLGQWAVGRVPEGTFITPGMFAPPPLSSEEEADSIILPLAIPAGEAAFGTLQTGDTVAMIGRENPVGGIEALDGDAATGAEPQQAPLSLIGILRLERMQGGNFYYILPPSDALRLEHMVNRYLASSDRKLWKLGADITAEIIQQALDEQNARER